MYVTEHFILFNKFGNYFSVPKQGKKTEKLYSFIPGKFNFPYFINIFPIELSAVWFDIFTVFKYPMTHTMNFKSYSDDSLEEIKSVSYNTQHQVYVVKNKSCEVINTQSYKNLRCCSNESHLSLGNYNICAECWRYNVTMYYNQLLKQVQFCVS